MSLRHAQFLDSLVSYLVHAIYDHDVECVLAISDGVKLKDNPHWFRLFRLLLQ